MARAVRFYGEGIGLPAVKREKEWSQLKLGEQTIWLMKLPAGQGGTITREYSRHWTPVHLHIHVDDIDETIKRVGAVGGKLEGRPKASLANLVDPSGNGVDVVQAPEKR